LSAIPRIIRRGISSLGFAGRNGRWFSTMVLAGGSRQ
jgi:hypothetical protein